MIEIDGAEISRWLATANEVDLARLIGAEYSDPDDIWAIEAADNIGLVVISDGSGLRQKRPGGFFAGGSFFFRDETAGRLVQDSIRGSLSEADKAVLRARDTVARHGFLVSDFGGDLRVIRLAHFISEFEAQGSVPDEDWSDLHLILSEGEKQTVMRAGAKLVEALLDKAESDLKGRFDVFRRVTLAFLYRHTNNLDKALLVSEVVDLPRTQLAGGNRSIAVLSTTRAAALLDVAERKQDPTQRADLLHKARLAANRANAIGEGDSVEVMLVYQRIKKLEKLSI